MQEFVKNSNNFNFLRLLLAVLVLLSHSPELIDGDRHREILTRLFHTISFGELAVDGFFLLSGYLIVQSWQRTPELLTFLKKRIFRIYPGFIAATLVSAFVVGPLGASLPNYFAQFNVFYFLKGMLLLQPPVVPSVFTGQPYPEVNGPMWTISYEFRCYLLVAVFGMLGVIKRQRLWCILYIFFLALSMSPNAINKINFLGSYYLFGKGPGEFIRFLSFFFAGGCFYLFRHRISYSKTWVLIALPVVILSLFERHTVRLILPTLGAYIFFWFAFLPLPLLQRFGKYSDVSYGVYLYGWPIQKLLCWYFPSSSPWLVFALTCGASFACGQMSWHLVEKHFLPAKAHKTAKT